MMEEAIRQQPDYADALAGLAGVHAMRFTFTTDPLELAEALEFTRRAIDAVPDHAPAHVWKAYALWRQERTEEAITAIRRAAVLDPGNHQAPYFLACMLFSREEHAAALPYYQRAVEVGPTSGFAWLGLGSTHLELGNFVEAEWSFRRAIGLEDYGNHSTAGTAGYLGECLRRAGRLDEARAECLAGLEAVDRTDHMYRDSFRAVCLNALGRTALELGEVETARTAFLQCEQHLEGRPRTLGGGHLRCQARAGRAAADRDAELLADARDAFARHEPGNWSWLWQCSADVTRRDLDRAAESLGPDPA
jgi:tetratricopeptide (TPR) repeat protein